MPSHLQHTGAFAVVAADKSQLDELCADFARSRRRTWWQMLSCFVVLTVVLVAYGYLREQARQDFQRQIIANCNQNRANSESLNKFVTTLQETTNSSRVLTPEEKAERIRLYQMVKITVPECPR